MNAAQRLTEVRNIFHMNQTEFAGRTGITSSLISQMERGTATVTWKTAHIIEKELGISAEWVMTGEGEIAADDRGGTEGRGKMPSPDRFPAVSELLGIFAASMTPADWEALNGICERVLRKQAPVPDLRLAEKLGA